MPSQPLVAPYAQGIPRHNCRLRSNLGDNCGGAVHVYVTCVIPAHILRLGRANVEKTMKYLAALAILVASPAIACDGPHQPTFKIAVNVDRGQIEYVYLQARDSIAARKIAQAQFGKAKVVNVTRVYK